MYFNQWAYYPLYLWKYPIKLDTPFLFFLIWFIFLRTLIRIAEKTIFSYLHFQDVFKVYRFLLKYCSNHSKVFQLILIAFHRSQPIHSFKPSFLCQKLNLYQKVSFLNFHFHFTAFWILLHEVFTYSVYQFPPQAPLLFLLAFYFPALIIHSHYESSFEFHFASWLHSFRIFWFINL